MSEWHSSLLISLPCHPARPVGHVAAFLIALLVSLLPVSVGDARSNTYSEVEMATGLNVRLANAGIGPGAGSHRALLQLGKMPVPVKRAFLLASLLLITAAIVYIIYVYLRKRATRSKADPKRVDPVAEPPWTSSLRESTGEAFGDSGPRARPHAAPRVHPPSGRLDPLKDRVEHLAQNLSIMVKQSEQLKSVISRFVRTNEMLERNKREVREIKKSTEEDKKSAEETARRAACETELAQKKREDADEDLRRSRQERDDAKRDVEQATAERNEAGVLLKNIRRFSPALLRQEESDGGPGQKVKEWLLNDVGNQQTQDAARRVWGALLLVEAVQNQCDAEVVDAIHLLSRSVYSYPRFGDSDDGDTQMFLTEIVNKIREQLGVTITRFSPQDEVNHDQMEIRNKQMGPRIARVFSWYVARGGSKRRAVVEA